jgi:hypothetical protein
MDTHGYMSNKLYSELVIIEQTWYTCSMSKWYDKPKNKEHKRIYNREWRIKRLNTSIGRYKELLRKSKQGIHECTLTFEQFSQFDGKPCFYCGETEERRGIDRIDNDKGYIPNNCVSCCKKCNYMKRKLPLNDFINQCKKISSHAS